MLSNKKLDLSLRDRRDISTGNSSAGEAAHVKWKIANGCLLPLLEPPGHNMGKSSCIYKYSSTLKQFNYVMLIKFPILNLEC